MKSVCYHCNDSCNQNITFDNKVFCCNGCQMVYQLLNDNGLTNYYGINEAPGLKPNANTNKYRFLQNEELASGLLTFQSSKVNKITLLLPQIHCSSCIWLLENLYRLNAGVTHVQVNFIKRTAYVSYNPNTISLYELAILLDKIGYPPVFEKKKEQKSFNKSLIIKLGVAGFCFGNIMLLSFPEYLGVEQTEGNNVNVFFQWLILALSIPIIIYSAFDYLKSGFKSLNSGIINIDVPISIGILTLYIKSSYDIIAYGNASYMDSFAGFIFFLLIGKWFQSKTYSSLSFDRNYESYFPIGVSKVNDNEEKIIGLDELKIDDTLCVRNEEIIPADSVLLSPYAQIDYSFVTGESTPISVKENEKIFAGGKLVGKLAHIKITKSVKQSYLTHLWNQDSFKKKESKYSQISNAFSKRFTIAVLLIALLSGISWFFIDSSQVIDIVVSVLIVACPCALALAVPFTFGTVMRLLGKRSVYLKNIFVIEQLASATDIVFDKTGTITNTDTSEITYTGTPLTSQELSYLRAATKQSAHTLSKAIFNFLDADMPHTPITYKETIGKGVWCTFNNDIAIKYGSSTYVGGADTTLETAVHIEINNTYKGKFVFTNSYIKGFKELSKQLKKQVNLHVLSGDNESERTNLEQILNQKNNLNFNQKPIDKLRYIKALQTENKKVVMVGDGLNDAGALKQSNVGIVVTANTFNFTPSSDIILKSKALTHLDNLVTVSKKSLFVLKLCFGFSVSYNILGLYFAVTGNLTPLVAAILMPISSIFIVFSSTLLVNRLFLKHYTSKE